MLRSRCAQSQRLNRRLICEGAVFGIPRLDSSLSQQDGRTLGGSVGPGAVRLSCQGTKPRISILMRLNRGLCVSDVVKRDLSCISIISSSPEGSELVIYGLRRVCFEKKCRVGGPGLCRVVVPGEGVRPGTLPH